MTLMPVSDTEAARRARGGRHVLSLRMEAHVKGELERLARAERVSRSQAVTLLVMRAVEAEKKAKNP